MARRKTKRFSGAGGKNYLWTVVLFDDAMSTTTEKVPLVADSDWVGAAGQPSATVIAIRGYMAFRSLSTSASGDKWYIGKLDKDVAAPANPEVADTYVDEDIMYTGGCAKSTGTAAAVQLYHEMIDIKAKRRIKGGMELILAHRATVSSQIQVTGVLRTLLLLNA